MLVATQPATGQVAHSVFAEGPQTDPCSYGFVEAPKGVTNISVVNPAAGQTVVAAAASNISATEGQIEFDSDINHSVWWTQSVGRQQYSFRSDGGVAGHISCSLGLSLKLLKQEHGQTLYLLPTAGYSEFLVVVACYGAGCDQAYAAGVRLLRVSGGALGYTLTFFYGLLNFSGPYLALNVSSSRSSAFLIGVSHATYGWVVGTVSPPNAIVLVNGTPYPHKYGVINFTLPFGIYNITFLAKGYFNMSVVVAVAGGQVTPLSVSLSSPTVLLEKTLAKVLGYAVIGLFFALATVALFFAAKRGVLGRPNGGGGL